MVQYAHKLYPYGGDASTLDLCIHVQEPPYLMGGIYLLRWIIYILWVQVQPLFVVNFQYQSCKIVVFLPFSLSCSQERIVCLNHKPKTKNHGLLWTKVLPVRLHNPSMSFVLGMTITLSSSIFLFYNLLNSKENKKISSQMKWPAARFQGMLQRRFLYAINVSEAIYPCWKFFGLKLSTFTIQKWLEHVRRSPILANDNNNSEHKSGARRAQEWPQREREKP